MAGKWCKKVPEFVYFIEGSNDWLQGPYVNKPKGYADKDLKIFKLVAADKEVKQEKKDIKL